MPFENAPVIFVCGAKICQDGTIVVRQRIFFGKERFLQNVKKQVL
jgi:hypothetical protein